MYIEIHPFFYDTFAVRRDMHAYLEDSKGTPSNKFAETPQSAYYIPMDSQVIRLDAIRRMYPEAVSDDSVKLTRLAMTENPQDDILISAEEAEEIKKKLLKGQDRALENEISHLTAAIRDLWQLLRARMR